MALIEPIESPLDVIRMNKAEPNYLFILTWQTPFFQSNTSIKSHEGNP